jgi:hypothetical protein
VDAPIAVLDEEVGDVAKRAVGRMDLVAGEFAFAAQLRTVGKAAFWLALSRDLNPVPEGETGAPE